MTNSVSSLWKLKAQNGNESTDKSESICAEFVCAAAQHFLQRAEAKHALNACQLDLWHFDSEQ